MKVFIQLFLIALLAALIACKKEKLDFKHTGELYLDHATDVATALAKIERGSDMLWPRAGWWNSANIFEALLDYAKTSGLNISGVCKKIYADNISWARGGFKNRSYDDNAWWALAWIKAYDLYGESKYLETAEDIFADMAAGGWDDKCGGGMAWQNNERYKNAITNELFLTLAAKLAERQNLAWKKNYYLNWALREWQWLDNSGMQNGKHLFNDGLDPNCTNNGQTTWTYNQGVILGGLTRLYGLTGNDTFLVRAKEIAVAAMSELSSNDSILTEPCGSNCGTDGVQFKGIFIRYLSELNLVVKDQGIKSYILKNADTAWINAKNNDNLFDILWQGPYKDWTGSASGVGLDLLNAAALQARM